MKEVTYYISDDGMQFTDSTKCIEHELDVMEAYSDLKVYGAHNKRLHKLYAEESYNRSKKVCIPSKKALEHLKALYHYAGFYIGIPFTKESIGIWRWKGDWDGHWVKDEKEKK